MPRGSRGLVRDKKAVVHTCQNFKSQAAWWIRRIHAVLRSGNMSIPSHFPLTPARAVDLFPDASGGGSNDLARGLGAVMDTWPPVYINIMYPDLLVYNLKNRDNVRLGRKLTFLEAAAGVAALIMAPDKFRNGCARIHTDNMGLVISYRKGHSRCLLTYTCILAMRSITRAFNAKLEIIKVPRCSNKWATIADSLSKGQIKAARQDMGVFKYGQYSSTFYKWLCNPQPSRVLGLAIVKELAAKHDVVIFDTEWSFEVDSLIAHNQIE